MNDLQLTGAAGTRAIAQRVRELEKDPPKEFTARTRAEAMSDHMHALYRYARGDEQLPEPTREHAIAIHDSYYMLLDENRRLREECGAERALVHLEALVELCPALDRWRTRILESPKRSPLERAAAWELTALLEELEGHFLEAEFARMYAEEAIASVKGPRSEVAA